MKLKKWEQNIKTYMLAVYVESDCAGQEVVTLFVCKMQPNRFGKKRRNGDIETLAVNTTMI